MKKSLLYNYLKLIYTTKRAIISGANKKYKDSVFTALFREPEKRLELYNALSGKNLPPDTPVTDATLPNVLFMGRINDLAFVVENKLVVLIEHQSTICPNMPLRLLLYIARIYEEIIDTKIIYDNKLLKIPMPEFYVLYNGTDKLENIRTLCLSDAFKSFPQAAENKTWGGLLELKVNIINVNCGRNPEIIAKSENLEGYAIFIATARKYSNAGMEFEDALTKAVKECIEMGIIADFLKINGSWVVNMLTEEFNLETAKKVWMDGAREEGREEGIEIGKEAGKLEMSKKLLDIGLAPEKVSDLSGLPLTVIISLRKN